jgi:threonine aldolase
MIRFNCDYSEGAHPRIMEAMVRTNMEQTPGYGEDVHCINAANMIKKLCGREDIGVHFLVGGTQANLTVISAMLRPHQGVICCQTGHINVHETGAIEATGHKVLAVNSGDGKLTGEMIRGVCRAHFEDDTHEHMVMPGAVYISNSTEIGTVYTASELMDVRRACDEYDLYLFLDGARLGYAMAAEPSVTYELLAKVCDVFYIGGTKQGALFGEAVVIVNPAVNRDFRYFIKQRGGMLAKGRLLGIQFEELMRDGLYMELAKSALEKALRIKRAAVEKGYALAADSPSNQQFIIVPDEKLEKLNEKYAFSYMGRVDEKNSQIRICTSWATSDADVEALIADL